jgi:hypothetical protein
MYCKRCSARLPPAPVDRVLETGPWLGNEAGQIPYASPPAGVTRCTYCFRKYDLKNARTYRESLRLTPREICVKLLLTTVFGLLCALIVSFHQMAQASGH